MKIQELISKEVELSKAREVLIVDHKKALSDIDSQLKKVRENISLSGANYDLDKIALAMTVIQVRGDASKVVHGNYSDQNRENERTRAVREAIEDLAINGAGKLKTKYFGVKNYSGFGDQGCDCSYGMGPKHGNIVFSVELTRDKRNTELTPDEIEAAIYYLQNIKDIQAKAKAA